MTNPAALQQSMHAAQMGYAHQELVNQQQAAQQQLHASQIQAQAKLNALHAAHLQAVHRTAARMYAQTGGTLAPSGRGRNRPPRRGPGGQRLGGHGSPKRGPAGQWLTGDIIAPRPGPHIAPRPGHRPPFIY